MPDMPVFKSIKPVIIFQRLGPSGQDIPIVRRERTPFSQAFMFSEVGWVSLVKPSLKSWPCPQIFPKVAVRPPRLWVDASLCHTDYQSPTL